MVVVVVVVGAVNSCGGGVELAVSKARGPVVVEVVVVVGVVDWGEGVLDRSFRSVPAKSLLAARWGRRLGRKKCGGG